MNKKIFTLISIVLLGIGFYFGFAPRAYTVKSIKIGILVPIDHTALREIVAGFKEVVEKAFPNQVTFNIQSAQGDFKLQRSIIELFVGQKMDMIVPVGTSATQMTLSLVKKEPIVSLAALYSEEEREKRHPKNITGVSDEIGPKKKLDLIKAVLPNLHHFTIIVHGGDEKSHKEAEILKSYSKAQGIDLQILLIQSLPDLGSAGKSVDKNSQAILILKDNVIASGIRMLVAIAKDRRIPLMTSDEGTVKEGATIALGVRERAIGEAGGKLAVKILQGYPIQDLPVQEMQKLTIFYSPHALQLLNIEITTLQEYAHKNNYALESLAHSNMTILKVKKIRGQCNLDIG